MIRVAGFELRPRLWPSLATLLLLPLLIALGFWQLDRAEQKHRRQQAYEQESAREPVELSLLVSGAVDDPRLAELPEYRRVRVRGTFEPSLVWLLDNRTHRGQAGYYVYSPLRMAGSELRILVNRGWVPVGPDRRVLPEIETPPGQVAVDAVIKFPPERVILAGKVGAPTGKGVEVAQYIDFAGLERSSGWTLAPFLLRLDPGQPWGYVRDWPLPGFGEDRHLAYAVQWFGLAFALAAIYVGVNTRRRGTATPSTGAGGPRGQG